MARRSWTHEQLVAGVRAGDRRALARAISLVENRDPRRAGRRAELYPETGSAFAIGITGPPGVGKSSLIGALVAPRPRARAVGRRRLGRPVEPVHPGRAARRPDPARRPLPRSRRVHPLDGHAAGISAALAEATLQSLLLLDAAGTDVVFLETVGTGQSEVEVMGIADEVVLVLMPGSGDSVQALKAGIMEIPDVIAINKMDQPGAKAMLSDIRAVLALDPERERGGRRSCSPRRCAARASTQLWDALVERRDAARGRRPSSRSAGARTSPARWSPSRRRVRASAIEAAIADDPALAELVAAVQRRELDPLTAVDRIVDVSRCARQRRDAAGARRPHRRPRAARRGLPRHARLLLRHARRARRPCRHPQGREPPADRARSRSVAPTTRSRS